MAQCLRQCQEPVKITTGQTCRNTNLLFRAPESERVLLISAAILRRDGKLEEAISLLAAWQTPGCALMRAQLAIASGDAKQVQLRLNF